MSWTHLVNALWHVPLPSSLATQSKSHRIQTRWMPVIDNVRIQHSIVNVIETLSILLQPLQPSRFDIDIMGSQWWQTSQLKSCKVGVWFFNDNVVSNLAGQRPLRQQHRCRRHWQRPYLAAFCHRCLQAHHWLRWRHLPECSQQHREVHQTDRRLTPKSSPHNSKNIVFDIDNVIVNDRQCCIMIHPPSSTRRAILRVPFISCRKPSNLTAWGHPSLGKRSIRRRGEGPWSLRPGTYYNIC